MSIEITDRSPPSSPHALSGHLDTVRPIGSVQAIWIWFEFDGDAGVIRFAHTTKRDKFREAWSLDTVGVDGNRLSLELESEAVRQAAVEYLGDAEHGLADVQLVRAASDDGQSATVTVSSVWYAPMHTELLPISVPIEVTATARSVFH